MPAYICVTCGVQYADRAQAPLRCVVCEDERQYVGWDGQRWTTLADMRSHYRNEWKEEEPGLTSIVTVPTFAIGQRALLLQSPAGNLLWDCVSYLDDETIASLRRLGGIQAMALSHPHFYATGVEWSDAFGGVPVFIHGADRQWVMRGSPHIVLWEGDEIEPLSGLTLLRLGGHFDGSAVLYWPAGANGRGAVLAGDTIQVVMDRRYVSLMYSYPNHIPLSAGKVSAIAQRMRRYRFDRLYGAFSGRTVPTAAQAALDRSVDRYTRRLEQYRDVTAH